MYLTNRSTILCVTILSLLWATHGEAQSEEVEYVELRAVGGITIRCYVDGVEQEGTHTQPHTRDARLINLQLSNPESIVSCESTQTIVAELTPAGRALLEGPLLGSVTLSWTPPTQNIDGTALTDLTGYKIYWGTDSNTGYPNDVTVLAPNISSYVVENLSSGQYRFVATAFDSSGNESVNSNEAMRIVP